MPTDLPERRILLIYIQRVLGGSQAANVYAKHDTLAFYEPRINYFADEYCKGLKYIHINQLIRNSGGEPKKEDFNIPEKMVSCGAFVDITAEDFYNNVLKHDLQGHPRKVFAQLKLVARAEKKMFRKNSSVVRKLLEKLDEVHAADLDQARERRRERTMERMMERMREKLWEHYQTLLKLARDPENWWNDVLLINRQSHNALYKHILKIRKLKEGSSSAGEIDGDERQSDEFRKLQSDAVIAGLNGAGDKIISQAEESGGTKAFKLMENIKSGKLKDTADAVCLQYTNKLTGEKGVATALVVHKTPADATQSNTAKLFDKLEMKKSSCKGKSKENCVRKYLTQMVGFEMSHDHIDLKNTCDPRGRGTVTKSSNWKNDRAIFIDPSGTFRVDKEQPFAFYAGAYKKQAGDK